MKSKVRIYSEVNEEKIVQENLKTDYLGRFLCPVLQNEFILYCMEQKSSLHSAAIGILLTTWAFAESLASISFHTNDSVEFPFDVLTLIFIGFSWVLGVKLFNQNFWNHQSRRTLNHSYLQVAFIICLNMVIILKVARQIATGDCPCIPAQLKKKFAHHFVQTSSSTNAEPPPLSPSNSPYPSIPECPDASSYLNILSFQMKVVMSSSPLLITALLYEPRLYVVLGCNCVMWGLIIYNLSFNYYNLLPGFFAFFILSILFLDLHQQRIKAFLNNMKVTNILKERERDADAVHAMEMRHMIGNVAHDLKTVRTVVFFVIKFVSINIHFFSSH
jgi:hypothetical protein